MSYTHLSKAERKVIYSMRRDGQCSLRRIAKALGRHVSTISRELRRNCDPERGYEPGLAYVFYCLRRERLVHWPKTGNEVLMERVREGLEWECSPEQVAGRLRRVDFAHDPTMWISHESIYRYIRSSVIPSF